MSPASSVSPIRPTRPWVASRTHRLTRWLQVAAVVSISALIVLVTPLAGFPGVAIVAIPLHTAVGFVRTVKRGSTARRNEVAGGLIVSSFVILVAPWLSIVYTVFSRGYRAIYSGFFTTDMRLTAPDSELTTGGIEHAIIGTLLVVLIASIISIPLGIMSGVYITEIRGRFTKLVRFIIQAMSGVPSIVAGLFVYSTLVLTTKSYSGLAGGLALAVLMIPTVARTSEEVLKLVPEDLRYAAYALGSSQASNVFRVVIPTVRSGLVTSGILGVARVAGETAPLLMTAQYFVAFKSNPFDGPIATLPVLTFSFLQNGSDFAVARAWGAALVLLTLILVLFVLARSVSSSRRGSRR